FGATDPNIVEQSATHFTSDAWPAHRDMLLDIHDSRLQLMDECGIGKAVLSLLSPGIQSLHDPAQAVDWAQRLNDYAAKQVAHRPDRFASFAALPMQDPAAATTEIRRAVTELGLVGALVNGFSQVGDENTVVYLDDPRYAEFWSTVEELDVPVYLHPRDPLESTTPQYHGHPWLYGSAWAFSVETGTHALRLMGSGLFDRIDIQHSFGHYLRNNFYLTTSGNFRTPALLNTIQEVGADRLLFSADYPFEDMREAADWFDRLEINDNDHIKIARTNAQALLKM
ncbi:MAG: amidohydrolase, partial [Rhodococcus sp. (in: high G+C Gram-positive bacteria)]